MGRQAGGPIRSRLIPRVSFIVPARNAASTAAAALESLAGQHYSDFEVLLYDDGSDDGTDPVFARFAAKDPRFCLVGNERVGLVEALRRLIDASDAEFLARMDADDLCRPARLAKQTSLIETDDNLAAVSCLVNSFSDEGPTGPGMLRYTAWLNAQITPEQIERSVFVESPLAHPSVLMRRSAYERSKGYLDDGHPEDYHLWLEFYRLGYKMAKVDEVLLDWRDAPTRLSRTDDRYALEKFFDLKLQYLLDTRLANTKRITLWGAGKTGRRFSRALTKAGIEITEIIDIDPNKIGRLLHGTNVVPPPKTATDVKGDLLLAAVGADGAREKIAAYLGAIGLPPARYVFVA